MKDVYDSKKNNVYDSKKTPIVFALFSAQCA